MRPEGLKRGAAERPAPGDSCPFCAYAARQFTEQLIVYEDDDVLVFPSLHQKPANRGHCLVVTRAHVRNLYELPDDLAGPVLSTMARVARVAKSAFSADGISIRQHNDPAGGQDVFHIHFHVIPRFAGDGFETASFEVVDEATRTEQVAVLRRAW